MGGCLITGDLMHEFLVWSLCIAIITVAVLWSRTRPKKKHWYFMELEYLDRSGTWRLKGNFTIGLDRNGRTVSLRTLKKMVPPIHKWESWAQLEGKYQNGGIYVSQLSYLGYFADNQ